MHNWSKLVAFWTQFSRMHFFVLGIIENPFPFSRHIGDRGSLGAFFFLSGAIFFDLILKRKKERTKNDLREPDNCQFES